MPELVPLPEAAARQDKRVESPVEDVHDQKREEETEADDDDLGDEAALPTCLQFLVPEHSPNGVPFAGRASPASSTSAWTCGDRSA